MTAPRLAFALLSLSVAATVAAPCLAQTSLNPNPPAATRRAPDLTPTQPGSTPAPGATGAPPARAGNPAGASGHPDLTPDPRERTVEGEGLTAGSGTGGDVVDCTLPGNRAIRTFRFECARLGGHY